MKNNKLVRDKIPEIIRSKGIEPKIHTATEEEYKEKLREKLLEEVNEYLEDSNIEELADILEIVYTLSSLHDISIEELEEVRKRKVESNGGFKDRIILEK